MRTSIDADFRNVVSSGNSEPYVDEFGKLRRPLQRDEVLAGMKNLEMVKDNMDRIKLAFEHQVK